jgi:hypothetical protein
LAGDVGGVVTGEETDCARQIRRLAKAAALAAAAKVGS